MNWVLPDYIQNTTLIVVETSHVLEGYHRPVSEIRVKWIDLHVKAGLNQSPVTEADYQTSNYAIHITLHT